MVVPYATLFIIKLLTPDESFKSRVSTDLTADSVHEILICVDRIALDLYKIQWAQ